MHARLAPSAKRTITGVVAAVLASWLSVFKRHGLGFLIPRFFGNRYVRDRFRLLGW